MPIVPSTSTSAGAAEVRERSFAMVARPAPGERLDLLVIVTSVTLMRACAVAGPPEMAALRYGSISGKGNRVTVVTRPALANSEPVPRQVRCYPEASAALRKCRHPPAPRRLHRRQMRRQAARVATAIPRA